MYAIRSYYVDKNVTVNLAVIHNYLAGKTLDGCLHTLAFYASNLSSSHTKNNIERFQHMLRETEAREIRNNFV